MKTSGLAAVVLSAAMIGGVGTAYAADAKAPPKQAKAEEHAKAKVKEKEHVLYEARTIGSQPIDIKVTDGWQLPYCDEGAGTMECKFPIDFLKNPMYDFVTPREAYPVCMYAMRYSFGATYSDVDACAFELLRYKTMHHGDAGNAKNK